MTFLQTTQAQLEDATSKSKDIIRVLSDRGEKRNSTIIEKARSLPTCQVSC